MTKEVNFTVPWLDRLKPPTQREDYRDKSTRGLQLRVSPTGVKSFSYAFRFGSKMGRVTLGKYPDLDLKTARQKTVARDKRKFSLSKKHKVHVLYWDYRTEISEESVDLFFLENDVR